MEYAIKIKSSSGGFYTAVVETHGGIFKCAQCECAGWTFGGWCKHLCTFFDQDPSLLFDSAELSMFKNICRMISASPIADEYQRLKEAQRLIDNERKAANKVFKARNDAAKALFIKHFAS